MFLVGCLPGCMNKTKDIFGKQEKWKLLIRLRPWPILRNEGFEFSYRLPRFSRELFRIDRSVVLTPRSFPSTHTKSSRYWYQEISEKLEQRENQKKRHIEEILDFSPNSVYSKKKSTQLYKYSKKKGLK